MAMQDAYVAHLGLHRCAAYSAVALQKEHAGTCLCGSERCSDTGRPAAHNNHVVSGGVGV